jgi:hypothetical protein
MSEAVFETAAVTITSAMQALETEVHPEGRQAELTEKMKPFAANGPWRYAPDSERAKVRDEIVAEQEQRAGVKLFELGKIIAEIEPTISALVAATEEAPDSLEAFSRWRGTRGHSSSDQLGVMTLAELQRARFDREYASAKPTAVLHDYRQALADPYSPANSAFIRFVERRNAVGWEWPAGTTDDDVRAVGDLSKAIAATKAARVPAAARAAQAALASAKATAERARTLHKVRAVRP